MLRQAARDCFRTATNRTINRGGPRFQHARQGLDPADKGGVNRMARVHEARLDPVQMGTKAAINIGGGTAEACLDP